MVGKQLLYFMHSAVLICSEGDLLCARITLPLLSAHLLSTDCCFVGQVLG